MLSARIGRCKFTSRYVYEINGQIPSVVYVSRIYFPLMFHTHIVLQHKSQGTRLPVVNFSSGFHLPMEIYIAYLLSPSTLSDKLVGQVWEISIVSIPTIYRLYTPRQIYRTPITNQLSRNFVLLISQGNISFTNFCTYLKRVQRCIQI